MKLLPTTILLFLSVLVYSQDKQGNTANAEIFADAPFRMEKYNENGELKAIPIHIMAHDADGIGANIELMSIDIWIKNARDTVFQDLILFDNLSLQQFDSLIIHRSEISDQAETQEFNQSGYQNSQNHTIVFTETHDIIDGEDYVEIKEKFWYFTILIPAEKLAGYDDIIDFHIHFNIDWSVDDNSYLRVFRKSENLPKISKWYRGDTHYHTIFTQNLAETGEALKATKLAGKYIGLDWQFTTDHSCDFDNYGASMQENWDILGQQVLNLNQEDSSYIFIRGIEASLNNSDGKIVHALVYPAIENPFSNPYIGDGGGDASATSVYIDDMLDTLANHNGFCYAAHPFAEGDKLPDLIGGNVWNVSDADFPQNGSYHPSAGTVICNDISIESDIFSQEANKLFKDNLKGFQIWNLYNTQIIKNSPDNLYNPWNVEYDSEFGYITDLDEYDASNMMFRFNQNFDVIKFLWQKGLKEKNLNSQLQNWKAYISAGSDAHGSFNYSNTEMYYANYGVIDNNALGKLSTLVYCPNGMGANGENILKAMYNGNTVLSDGPVIAIGISENNDFDILPGNDTVISLQELSNYNFIVKTANTQEFGEITMSNLIVGTENQEYNFPLSNDTGLTSYNLLDLLNNVFLNNIPVNSYFYLRAELKTFKDFDQDSVLYRTKSQEYHSFTNPVWLKVENSNEVTVLNENNIQIIKQNDSFILKFNNQFFDKKEIFIINSLGQTIKIISTEQNTLFINSSDFKQGLYLIKIKTNQGTFVKKMIFSFK